ncbi:MAG: carboxypeptidase-like regulatory domain-containing protein, partial [Odoribacter sp.]|nr:carboxypeptidase-like regulatory domain-containing protein [Odoribacter sp.]
RSDVEKTFKEVNYQFSQVRRDHEVASVFDGLTYFDDLLTADVVRNTRNVLDIINSRDYKLKSKGKLLYEGDSVQIIAYEVTAPTLSTTGSHAVKKYAGEIYIQLKDMAVLKNVVTLTASDFTELGRNLVPVNEAAKGDVQMTITTNYKKLKSVYFLSGATIEYSYKETDGKEVTGKMEYLTTRVDMDTSAVIEGRQYYENIPMNENFWNRYSIYFEE